jgi:hypothetical protein
MLCHGKDTTKYQFHKLLFHLLYEGKKLFNGWGIDGVLYTFELIPRKAIAITEPLSRRNVTATPWKDRTDDNETEPDVS